MAAATLTLYLLTWNVATRSPVENINSLLNLENMNSTGKLPDLYVIGFQEVDSAVWSDITDSVTHTDPWTDLLQNTLRDFGYVQLKRRRLQGIVLNVFCLSKHFDLFRDVDSESKGTGWGKFWGNKGAVGIRFNIHGKNICFMNTHLKDGNHLDDRISMYNRIIDGIKFDVDNRNKILAHDYVFWLGDLNFRLGGDLTAEEIEQYVKDGRLNELLQYDQLSQNIRDRHVFTDFKEGTISFPPTYKYIQRSQDFNLERRPAWTDRILYRVNDETDIHENLRVEQDHYTSHPEYDVSDHRPVTAMFDIVVRQEVPDAA
ncbi:hypothetical protein QAD02_005004 [Eretmocerus hayati]|uniref:Uncharacterized protein n=1 Tax=Eretmocerus hayati TaxID=131215 RepID=A0ACC2NRN7_9HYME|nr:hypothetical protein QAD02_005004 [Eretmocerus hayati]